MAFDAYMQFTDSTGKLIQGESQVQLDAATDKTLGSDLSAGHVFEISDFSFDIEQVLNISSATSGAGAGKVTFNPFSITRATDRASPILYMMCCAGQHFKMVTLYLRKAGGAAGGNATMSSGTTFLRFDFALVAVKTISWSGSDGDEAPKEEVTFEFGALKVQYVQQDASGAAKGGAIAGMWNKIYNNNKFEEIKAM